MRLRRSRGARPTATRFPGSRVLALIVVAFMIEACGAGPTTPQPPTSPVTSGASTPASEPAAAADGLCVAIAALPDAASAEQAFVNLAHDPLHGLAAEPRLDRTLSARILEAMDRVEKDFATAATDRVLVPDGVLAADLSTLRIAATDALGALGIDTAACTS